MPDALPSQTKRRVGATPRQARLVDWLRHPEEQLPAHPAIDARQAMFTAAEIVEATGDLFPSRRACLDDLDVMLKRDSVIRMGNRWRYLWPGEREVW